MPNSTISKRRVPKFGRTFQGRLLAVSVPAAIITAGLFFGMKAIIKVDNFELPKEITRSLTAYMVPTELDAHDKPIRAPIKRIEVKSPPIIEFQTVVKTTVDIPGGYTGAAPAEYIVPTTSFGDMIKTASIKVNREARPLTQPIPTYPDRAARNGIEGHCEVKMDVAVTGKPYNIVATCTDRVFVRSAENAVSRVMFSPKVENGKRLEWIGVTYPLQYKLPE